MDKSALFTQLGRLDRAIAANLDDIRSSFDVDASLVLDFIVFISQRMKTDLFGYTRFTLKDFCEATGRRRQELAIKHPILLDGKKKVPEIQGLRFESVFDYTLIRMMHHNLVFTNVFQDKCGDKTVHMEAIRILSDVKMNFGRKSTEVKYKKMIMKSEAKKEVKKKKINWAIPGQTVSKEELVQSIRETEKGPFYSIEEIKKMRKESRSLK